jgi:NTE family protein
MENQTQSKTAFVLVGGGSFGAVQVGMLRALVAAGIAPDLVVGSSVGSINGAYFAGMPTAEGVAQLETLWRGLHGRELFALTLRSVLGLFMHRAALVDPSRLRRLIEEHLPYRELQAAALPLHVVTADFISGGAVCLSSGPAVEAILASCAIPGAFPPVCINQQFLVDGAVAASTPVDVAVGLGATRLIVLPTGFACALSSPPSSALANALHAITLLIAHRLVLDLERFKDQVEIVTLPPLCPLAVSPYDFSQAGELIERAAEQTGRWLDKGGMERHHVPAALQTHTHTH